MAKLRFITLEKLLEMKANNEAFALVEALPPDNFADGHIPGAVNLPSARIIKEAEALFDKGDRIVVYCSGYPCEASTLAARKLLNVGFEEVYDFKGGKQLWLQAGFELEK